MAIAEVVNTDMNSESVPLANRILLYLYLNPSAKDTLEGVAQWWVKESPAKVRRVLDVLVDLKVVSKVRSGRSTLYMMGERPLEPFLDGETLWSNR